MRVLIDQGTPVPIKRYLTGHEVTLSVDAGWDRLRNGELLTVAENDGFEVLLTTDKNLRYQQDLKGHRYRGDRPFTMARVARACSSGAGRSERGQTRQLCRGGHSLTAESAFRAIVREPV